MNWSIHGSNSIRQTVKIRNTSLILTCSFNKRETIFYQFRNSQSCILKKIIFLGCLFFIHGFRFFHDIKFKEKRLMNKYRNMWSSWSHLSNNFFSNLFLNTHVQLTCKSDTRAVDFSQDKFVFSILVCVKNKVCGPNQGYFFLIQSFLNHWKGIQEEVN